MERALLRYFDQMEWLPHPSLSGISTRFTAIDVPGHPAVDALVARLEPGGIIPRHVRAETCEIAYVLNASGRLILGEADSPEMHPLREGSAMFIPPGVPHMIENTSSETMLIIAVHTVTRG